MVSISVQEFGVWVCAHPSSLTWEEHEGGYFSLNTEQHCLLWQTKKHVAGHPTGAPPPAVRQVAAPSADPAVFQLSLSL